MYEEKIKEILLKAKKAVVKLFAWSKENLKYALGIAIVFLLAVIGLYLLVKQIIFPIIGIAILIWGLADFPVPNINGSDRQSQTLPPLENVCGILSKWAYSVQLSLAPALMPPIRKPTGEAEVIGKPPLVFIGSKQRFQFYIPLTANNDDVAIDLEDMKELIQCGFENRLAEMKLPNQPTLSGLNNIAVPVMAYDGVPIVSIADITREKLRLVVSAFWVNNSEMAAYVRNWHESGISYKNGGVKDTDENY